MMIIRLEILHSKRYKHFAIKHFSQSLKHDYLQCHVYKTYYVLYVWCIDRFEPYSTYNVLSPSSVDEVHCYQNLTLAH